MGERKVISKYYPPDFDPAKVPRGKKADLNMLKVRMMLPMSIRCGTCGTFMAKVRFFSLSLCFSPRSLSFYSTFRSLCLRRKRRPGGKGELILWKKWIRSLAPEKQLSSSDPFFLLSLSLSLCLSLFQ